MRAQYNWADMISHAWRRLHVLRAGANCMFSLAWHQLHVYACLHWLHVYPRLAQTARFPRLALTACFPAHDMGCRCTRTCCIFFTKPFQKVTSSFLRKGLLPLSLRQNNMKMKTIQCYTPGIWWPIILCSNRWLVNRWKQTPDVTRPALPRRWRALACDTQTSSKLSMPLVESYLYRKLQPHLSAFSFGW